MNKPRISVVMTVYNSERFLDEAISSILHQTFSDFEFIIVNDGSTDTSLKIIKKYQDKNSRIILINLEKNKGIAVAANDGLERAQGKYIARIDADDISLPSRLELQYAYLESHPEIFLVAGSFNYIDTTGGIISQISREIFIDNHEKSQIILDSIGYFHHPTWMFRNSHEHVYREKMIYAEDRDFLLRLITEGNNLFMIPTVVAHLRMSDHSASTIQFQALNSFMKKANDFFLKRDIYDAFDPLSILSQYPPEQEKSLDKILALRTLGAKYSSNTKNTKLLRKYIRLYWREKGFFTDKKLWGSYIVSFFPTSLKNILKRYL